MSYLSRDALVDMGFRAVGKSIKVSDKACIYNAERVEIGDYSRIDDFCIISGNTTIGRYCHITPMCLIAGGEPGVYLADFCTLAYGVKVFAQSDDYSGKSMVNSLIPRKYKNEYFAKVELQKHVIVGACSVIFPGVSVGEGCAFGAMTLVNRSTDPWGIYSGVPAKRIKERKKDLLDLEKQFLREKSC
ncbi:MAG: acyltransferase [Cellvibrionaceae bacterium]